MTKPLPSTVDYALEPFLEILRADGFAIGPRDHQRIATALSAWPGEWTGNRLANVLCPLLTASPEDVERFRYHFEAFFTVTDEEENRFRTMDVSKGLEDLKRLEEQDVVSGVDTPISEEYHVKKIVSNKTINEISSKIARPNKRYFFSVPSRTLLRKYFVLVIIIFIFSWVSVFVMMDLEFQARPFFLSMTIVFFVAIMSEILLSKSDKIKYIIHSIIIKWKKRFSSADPFETDLHLPALHPIPRRLSREAIDTFADGLGRFTSVSFSQRLDVAATVNATVHAGGLPDIRLEQLRRDRLLMILEDMTTEARQWNQAANELADGLIERGVGVKRGWFRGDPAQISGPGGDLLDLEDLADHRQGYLVLLFSDGQALNRRSMRTIQDLARWPFIAWLDLRDPGLWDDVPEAVRRAGIPVFPATDHGLALLGRIFLSEAGDERWRQSTANLRSKLIAPDSPTLFAEISLLLGDAWMWACDCAMAQPIRLNVADALRHSFYHALPAERLDRLIALPGTRLTDAGLSFAEPVLRILRNGFLRHRSVGDQDKVLAFLLEAERQAEPPADSPSHLEWRWRCARIQTEIDPDVAAPEIQSLRRTAIGPAVVDAFKNFIMPNHDFTHVKKLILRKSPKSYHSKIIFGKLTGMPVGTGLMGYIANKYTQFLICFARVCLYFFSLKPFSQKVVNCLRWTNLNFRTFATSFSSNLIFFAANNNGNLSVYKDGCMIYQRAITDKIIYIKFSETCRKIAAVYENMDVAVFTIDAEDVVVLTKIVAHEWFAMAWIGDDVLAVSTGSAINIFDVNSRSIIGSFSNESPVTAITRFTDSDAQKHFVVATLDAIKWIDMKSPWTMQKLDNQSRRLIANIFQRLDSKSYLVRRIPFFIKRFKMYLQNDNMIVFWSDLNSVDFIRAEKAEELNSKKVIVFLVDAVYSIYFPILFLLLQTIGRVGLKGKKCVIMIKRGKTWKRKEINLW
ncbi:MAG: hypothetical protein H7839_15505 [Magnetococcus sp. YQC-5]